MYYANVPFEIKLKGEYKKSPFVSVSGKSGTIKVPAFYKSNSYYFRFSAKAGEYSFSTPLEQAKFVIKPYKGTNALLKKGGVASTHTKKYLAYADGSSFFYFADTIWFGATNRMTLIEFKKYLSLRKKQGFNAVQIVVGVPPEVDFQSAQAKNEGGHPFLKDFSVNSTYFDYFDKSVEAIVEKGLVPVIFGGWGHHIDILGLEKTKLFWREIVARYASYPVIFSLSGEADVFLDGYASKNLVQRAILKGLSYLPKQAFFLAKRVKEKGESRKLSKRIASWKKVGKYIKSINSFNRPLLAHLSRKVTAFELFGDSILTVNTIQSGHGEDGIDFIRNATRGSQTPIINIEPWYEGILGKYYAYDQRRAFWAGVLAGAKGHTYGAHGVWQVAKGDNFMSHWGKSEYKKAIKFSGADDLGKSVKFLEKFEWVKIKSSSGRINREIDMGSVDSKTHIAYLDKTQRGSFEMKTKGSLAIKWYSAVDFKLILSENTSSGKEIKIPGANNDKIAVIKIQQKS